MAVFAVTLGTGPAYDPGRARLVDGDPWTPFDVLTVERVERWNIWLDGRPARQADRASSGCSVTAPRAKQ